MIFEVWAPKADRVELVFRDERLPMRKEQGGWWRLERGDARPGDGYAFALDAAPPRPDPRSLHQPEGVHAPSRIVDHAAYRWRVGGFRAPPLASAIIYEMHVGTFTPQGTLDAATRHLDHLADLGISHVELMPLNSFDGERGWGYDGVAWFAPHVAYTGADGPDAVKRFVDACHERGLAVILDVVYNHLGPSGNYLAEFGPYCTDVYATPWGPAVNLDGPGSDEVRRLIIDNALMWLRDYRFDALRVDAVHAFHDSSAVHLLEQMWREVAALEAATARPLALIAESDLNDPRIVRSTDAGGYAIDAQWSDDFHHALHALLTGERSGYYADFGSVRCLAKAWRDAFVYDGRYSTYRARRHGRSAAGLDSARFLAYAQTHDQVGNRARGERLAHLVEQPARKLAAALVLLSPFVPLLFQGEEWGSRSPFQYFTDHADESLARAVREGRRREFAAFLDDPGDVPDPQDRATFHRSKLDWERIGHPPHAELLAWHRDLIRFRRSHAESLAPRPLGCTSPAYSESPPWMRIDLTDLTLAFNFAAAPVRLPANSDGGAEHSNVALASDPGVRMHDGGIELPPFSFAAIS